MAIVKDWVEEAVEELRRSLQPIVAKSWIVRVIEEHCPFKPGVLYMPVPRCDQCRFWRLHEISEAPFGLGRCERLDESVATRFEEVRPDDFFIILAGDPQESGAVYTRAGFGCVQWKAKP